MSASLKVYYSKTADNTFLPPTYVESLKANLDPKMALRMLEGQWVSISEGKIYHQYSTERNFKRGTYAVNEKLPIRMHWDFNIGDGKPLSTCASQYVGDEWHFFDEVCIETARTEQVLDEWASKGIFERPNTFIIHGDCNGRNRDTRSNRSDYQIIKDFMEKYTRKDGTRLEFKMQVPPSNPEVRLRHNTVNAYMMNALKQIRLFVYEQCKMLDKGWRLTKLKDGGKYIEDDSKDFQHITTAAGYGIVYQFKENRTGKSNFQT